MVEIIAALDVDSRDAALHWLDRVPGLRWVKLGSVLVTREGTGFARELAERGLSVFLDLKWHDIPSTVSGAVESARSLGVRMVTVHTLGGRTMLEAAARAAGPDLGVVGVTMLTSLDGAAYGEAVGRGHVDPEAEVERLTGTARLAGLRGVVCSPHEVAVVRRLIGPAGWIVVPGIRRPEDSTGDQVRIATPAQAAAAGATHLVIGRPLLQAKDPAVAFREMSEAAS